MQTQSAVHASPMTDGRSNVAELPRATSTKKMDEMIARLREGAKTFAALSLKERIALARSMQQGYLRVAEPSAIAGCKARGLPLEAAGDQWAAGPLCVVRHLRLIIESLESIERTGNTKVGKIGRTGDGNLKVQVFPGNAIDGILFSGVTVDVHMQPGIGEEQMHAARAGYYKGKTHDGRVVLVLGAGNVDAIVSDDVITKMFNEGKVCIVKMNPVNAFLGPYLEDAYAEPIARGFLAIAYGGIEEGMYLVNHPGVDEVHLTGSDRTYDAIVWGPPGPERERRKAQGARLVTKPVMAELGNVSPVIVAPGPYSRKELLFQAEEIAAAVVMGSAFYCCTARVVITPKGWPQREEFLAAIREVFSRTPARFGYYPGAFDRYRAYTSGRPNLWTSGPAGGGVLPWAFAAHADAGNRSDIAFRQESFTPVLFETAVGSNDPEEFLDAAVNFANDTLWGTLNATLIVHPKLQKDPTLGPAVERAIARLEYGTVGVNGYPVMGFAFMAPPWGAYPGSTPADIQSGNSFVHNTPMLEGIEKAVLRNPLTAFPKPMYFPSHRTATRLMPKLVALEERGSWAKVPGVVATAMRC
jgi:acyl-CoA reductase-like NAD-dependent aldehyde dehydrogenase